MSTSRSIKFCRLGALLLAMTVVSSGAWAADITGFKTRLEATKAEVATKKLADSNATLTRLGEMMKIGEARATEYGAQHAQFTKLMAAVVADADAMKGFTDAEIEGKWGEQGSGGDAVGIPLKSLGQFDETRAAMEMIIGPAHAYIFVKKWQTAQKSRWLDQANDELSELAKHLEQVH
jgi:hypothetical protein